jgi:NDP-sugar pyrophosphorylase family protein
LQVVVLAGGLATRMKPLSGLLPKILFPVAGRPFLDRQLDLLVRGGATKVLLCVRHLAHMVEAHLAASPPPLPVTLSDDGEQAAGTGGALIRALERGQLEPHFVVMYGDSYLPVDLRPLLAQHLASGLPATMAVLENDGRWDASNCVVEGQRVVRYEKIEDPAQRPPQMRWIDYGATALDRAWVESWPRTLPADLSTPLTRLSMDGKLGAFTVTERFYEIGSPAGLAELEAYLGASL